jgi:hypothetical protein
MAWETIVFRREELYASVWAQPVDSLAKLHRISGVGLAKICKKLDVPLPSRGYWAKLEAGKAPARPTLPPARRDQVLEHRINRWLDPVAIAPLNDEVQSAIEREANREYSVQVSETLQDPHPLIEMSLGILRKYRKFTGHGSDAVRNHRCVDIDVTPEHLDRALRIMDAVLKALEKRGYMVDVTKPICRNRSDDSYRHESDKPSRTYVQVGESFVDFGIEECWTSVAVPPPRNSCNQSPSYERRPTGRLALKLRNAYWHSTTRKTWADGKHQKVEQFLNYFIAAVIAEAERSRLRKLEEARKEAEEAERQRRRAEEEARREREAELIKDLDSRLANWTKAVQIRSLLEEAKKAAIAKSVDTSPESAMGRWITWAAEYAEKLTSEAVQAVKDREGTSE